jgi:Tfp pilus assembly protein PilO
VEPEKKQSPLTRLLVERLHNPIQLRIICCMLVLLAWYLALYNPLSSEIAAKTERLAREEKRLTFANEIDRLKDRLKPFQSRLPEKVDPTEYLQFVLGGIRTLPLKLIKMDQATPVVHGPYQVIVLRIDLEGSYKDIYGFIRWVEESPRLMRIDSVKIEPRSRDVASPSPSTRLVAHLTVLGIMG